MTRTIVQTTVSGWFIDAADPDGPRVRKKEGDNIISLQDFEQQKNLGLAQPTVEHGEGESTTRTPSQQRAATAAKGAHERKAERKLEQTAAEKAVPTMTSETGKILRGKTTIIKCLWVPLEHQTPAVARLYAAPDKRKVTAAQVEKAAGGHPVCGRERVIKVQDAFQAFLCAEHQTMHRRKIKREKLKIRRQVAKAAAR